jgi:hypothetical protein
MVIGLFAARIFAGYNTVPVGQIFPLERRLKPFRRRQDIACQGLKFPLTLSCQLVENLTLKHRALPRDQIKCLLSVCHFATPIALEKINVTRLN